MKTKIFYLYNISKEPLILSLLLISYFLSFELLFDVGVSSNSDLIYLESLYRDFFIRDFSLDGWLVSKAPYFFPDWFLYFILRYIFGEYQTSWYIYIFISFLFVQFFLYKTILLFAPKKRGVCFFVIAWSALLLIMMKDTPNGFGVITYFFPVYHSGALLLGLWILYLWLKNLNNEINNKTKFVILLLYFLSTI